MARHQYKYRKPPRRRIRFSRIFIALALVAALAYPFWEASRLTVDERTVRIPGLHANLRNIKVAFVSDIHYGPFFSEARIHELINRINTLSADIVILGGDYATNASDAITFFKIAPSIQARLGVFGVVGDTDRDESGGNVSQLIAEMKNYGCLPLTNNVASIKVGQTNLYVAGVDDYYLGSPDIASVASQVGRDDFVILVAHTPDILPQAFAAKGKGGDTHWFDLALFGHTHGGQVTVLGRSLMPGRTPLVAKRYLTGLWEENRASILVSNGVGVSDLPIRLFAPPQIHLLTLKSL